MTRVKICGLMEIEQAIAAAAAGADYLGLVFADSCRRVTPERAGKIADAIRRMKSPPALVGVFVNSPASEVNRVAGLCNLNWVQLSGTEPWAYCLGIQRPVIKTLHISAGFSAREIRGHLRQGYRLRPKDRLIFLLDTHVEGVYGGTGQTFDWQLAREIAAEYPVIVGGGLTLDNVVRLIEEVRPWGVDVSSGVETAGKKDIQKIEEFIRTVKGQE